MPSRVVSVASQRPLLDPSPTVLLIDDDEIVLTSLGLVLEDAGFRVLTARNGWQGLVLFRQQNPTVVITDIMMPEQDGIGIIVQMRRERPDAKIVAMSGGGYIDTSDYLPIARTLGADDTFSKAEDTDVLIAKVNELMRLSYRAAS